MIRNLLGFKALDYHPNIKTFTSPTQLLPWPGRLVSMKSCRFCGQEVPNPECSCGLYVSIDDALVRNTYANHSSSVIFLVETWGRTIVYSKGFRAKSLLIHAVVDTSQFARRQGKVRVWEMAYAYACELYGIEMISLPAAIEAVRIQWEAYNGNV